MLGLPSARRKQILALAVPIILGMMSQTVLNVVDTLMVSSLGAKSIAAVGFGSFSNFLCIAFVTGMATGVQAIASRRKGEGRVSETAVALNGGLLIVLAISIPLSALLMFAAPTFFGVLTTDTEVVDIGTPYLQVRLVAMIAVGVNFAFRGYWNGVNKSRLYLRTLIVMHISNVAISYTLIFGVFGAPAMGATGAAIGTAASGFIGSGYYIYLGLRHARGAGFLRGLPDRKTLVSMLKLSVPSGLQSMFFAAGLTALFTIVGRIGTSEVAAMNVLITVTMVAFLPGLGLGLAAATLVGQALGREDIEEAERWAWDVIKVGIAIMLCLGLPMAIAPEPILGAFFGDEPEALALAILPLRLAGLTVWSEAILMILLNSIMGAGATRIALVVNVGMQWLLFLPAAYLIGPVLGWGLIGVWVARICYRVLQSVVLMAIWRGRGWAKVEV
ncbi:MAG: MATE family efflux transporter [Myxococcales bacterium]|nr:MATE family efflux transporter [Myxococcales bacterium]